MVMRGNLLLEIISRRETYREIQYKTPGSSGELVNYQAWLLTCSSAVMRGFTTASLAGTLLIL